MAESFFGLIFVGFFSGFQTVYNVQKSFLRSFWNSDTSGKRKFGTGLTDKNEAKCSFYRQNFGRFAFC